jgi:hydrogenase expression/formation protein HypD
VRPEGNVVAQQLLDRVFAVGAAAWRGFGTIPDSGLSLRPAFAAFDAARRFPMEIEDAGEPPGCRCGEVLRGVIDPTDCALFGRACTPRNPVGPCMVSAEGSCAAHYKYGEAVV